MKMPLLDLHGISHDDADFIVEKFITDNIDSLPVKVITGHSLFFTSKVQEITEKYRLFCYKEHYVNDGCWIILKSQWIRN